MLLSPLGKNIPNVYARRLIVSINSISSQVNMFYGIDSVYNQRRRDNAAEETGYGERNTGPDTVDISNEAMEKYYAMKNGFDTSAETADENSQSSPNGDSFGKSYEDSKKFQKMNQAEILAFLKSDTFSQDAIGYLKSVAYDNKTTDNDGDDTSDMFVKAMRQNRNENTEDNSTDNIQNSEDSKGSFLNGDDDTEKELAKAIQRLEKEVRELTETYEKIMGGEGAEEEKFRLSQPIYKNLKDKSEELIGLKAQMKNLTIEKYTQKHDQVVTALL
jgi:ElaB/YqjD/DUF883 family membrane-anchored ribosome-binding protein